jgi:hypothetical protein
MTYNHELDEALLRMAVIDAVRAPSSHDREPWLFSITDGVLELRANRRRDPDERELAISCGAALGHLCASLRHRGVRPSVELLPVESDRDLFARVRVTSRDAPLEEDEELYRAIPSCHMDPHAFEPQPIALEAIAALRDAAEAEGAWLAPIQEPSRRHAISALVAQGRRGRLFDVLLGRAAHDERLAESAPLLAVLGVAQEDPKHWLIAGLALSRVLLRATHLGLSASFLDRPIEVPRLREAVRALVGIDGVPQLVLRFGHGRAVAPTRRRPIDEVMIRPLARHTGPGGER